MMCIIFIKKKYYYFFLLIFTLLPPTLFAQDSLNYDKAQNLTLVGKAKETLLPFQRINQLETTSMPKSVQGLAMNSAGIAVLFETNSAIIAAKWKLAEDKYFNNMTPIAHSGLDLYCLVNGKWRYVSVGKPEKGITDQNQVIIRRMDTTMKQFMLYLPLYNTVNDLEIGVDKQAIIKIPKETGINKSKRIVIYGSSIVQGASASRPGMAYPAIIQRKLGVDVINLGFSGSAKMEMEVAKYLATVPTDCYVLDCIPNQTADQVEKRALPFIKYLRQKHPTTPIIIVESVIRENGYFDKLIGSNVKKQNENIKAAYKQLIGEKYPNIYYVEASEFSGEDHEGSIDGTHLTDVGFLRISEAVINSLKKVL